MFKKSEELEYTRKELRDSRKTLMDFKRDIEEYLKKQRCFIKPVIGDCSGGSGLDELQYAVCEKRIKADYIGGEGFEYMVKDEILGVFPNKLDANDAANEINYSKGWIEL